MTEETIRKYMKLTGDLESYQRYVDYVDKLHSIKNKIFNQVLSLLECFAQVLIEDNYDAEDNVYSENFFSPDNLSVVLSPDEVEFLRKYKNEKI